MTGLGVFAILIGVGFAVGVLVMYVIVQMTDSEE